MVEEENTAWTIPVRTGSAGRRHRELDVVESFARGRSVAPRIHQASARSSACRMASISAILIAACTPPAAFGGARPPRAAPGPRPAPAPPRRAPRAARSGSPIQRPAATLDPVAMQDLVGVRPRRPVVRVPGSPRSGDRRHRAGTRDRVDAQRRQHRLDVQAAQRRQVAERRRLHGRRRRRHDGPPRRRPATPGSTASSRRARPRRSIPLTVEFTLVGANGNFPYLVSVFNAQTVITPAAYATGTTLDAHARRDRSLEARQLRPVDRRDVLPQRHLVGRHDAARHGRIHVLRRDRADGHGLPGRPDRRHRPVRRLLGRGPLRRPELQRPRGEDHQPPPDLDALRHRPVHGQARPPGGRALARPRGDGPAAVQGQGRGANDHVIFSLYHVLRPVRRRSGRATSRRPSSC